MLLYGSRAIRYHIPSFRKPKDWDLAGSADEWARLVDVLSPLPPHTELRAQTSSKEHRMYGNALVEFAVRERDKYWDYVADVFKDEPVLEEPVLGEMRVPPLSFLLMTKHCSLIYPLLHWYKNLEDFYLLKSYVPEIDAKFAPLLALTQENAQDVYSAYHATIPTRFSACHPKLPPPPRPEWHAMLHERMKLGEIPMVAKKGAWQAFPDVGEPEKTQLMMRLFAEEVMVLMGHFHMETDQLAEPRPLSEMSHAALRMLITGHLPPAWRYFGVNHYQEIESLVASDFYERLRDMNHLRPTSPAACSGTADLNDLGPNDARSTSSS